jgi:hypothetical protein
MRERDSVIRSLSRRSSLCLRESQSKIAAAFATTSQAAQPRL